MSVTLLLQCIGWISKLCRSLNSLLCATPPSFTVFCKVRTLSDRNICDGAASPYLLSMISVVNNFFVLSSLTLVSSPERYPDHSRLQLLSYKHSGYFSASRA